jgi:hypothetical protein
MPDCCNARFAAHVQPMVLQPRWAAPLGLQDVRGAVGHQLDRALDQRDGDAIGRVRPMPNLGAVDACNLTVSAPREGVNAQRITDLIAKPVEVGEQPEILLHCRG